MVNNNSAKKRIKINQRNNQNNNIYRSRVKTFTKNYLVITQRYKANPTEEVFLELKESLKLTLSQLDKASKRRVYHKNNVAKKKSNLLKVYNQLL